MSVRSSQDLNKMRGFLSVSSWLRSAKIYVTTACSIEVRQIDEFLRNVILLIKDFFAHPPEDPDRILGLHVVFVSDEMTVESNSLS